MSNIMTVRTHLTEVIARSVDVDRTREKARFGIGPLEAKDALIRKKSE